MNNENTPIFGEYSEAVLDHFLNPRNAGIIENADAEAEAGSDADGDVLKIYMAIKNGHISEARFKARGCVAAIAAGSALTELVKGKPVSSVKKLTDRDVIDYLGGLPPQKIHCSVLAEEVLRKALSEYER